MYLSRVNYYIQKIKRAWADGVLWQKARIFLGKSIRVPIEVLAGYYFQLKRADRKLPLSNGFADHRMEKSHLKANLKQLNRIVEAYNLAKQKQTEAPSAFQIHGLWNEWLDINYGNLKKSLQKRDLPALASLLENFNREQVSIGLGSGFESYLKHKTSLFSKFYIRYAWCKERDTLLSLDFDIEKVRFPQIGNPVGIYLNGDVIYSGAFRYIYHAVEIGSLLRDVLHAKVVEIGAGMGGQAYQAIRLSSGNIEKYIIFDIPEVLAISSYFLILALPEKKIRLFGEGPVSIDADQDFDIGLFPHFSITALQDESVDMFFNSTGLAEMDRNSSAEYLRIIERACKKYFLHINHDIRFKYRNSDGTISENILGSELIPNEMRFKRIFKKPHLFVRLEDKYFSCYEYLYERMERKP